MSTKYSSLQVLSSIKASVRKLNGLRCLSLPAAVGLLALAVGGNGQAAAQRSAGTTMAAPSVVVRASIDSAAVTMGGRTALHIEVLKPAGKGAMANLPKFERGVENDFCGAEVREITVDSTALPEGRMQVNYNIVLQPFEPGTLNFPQFKYVVDADTFRSEVTTIKVIEPEMPKVMRDSLLINPMEGPASIKARWYDYIPSLPWWWFWVVIPVVLIALGVVLFLLYKKNGPGLLPRKKIVPPHILALNSLNNLKAKHLPENGRDKEYYTELTDILRTYLDGRFHIYAREMSSTQILYAVDHNKEISGWSDRIAKMLEIADIVKFAKVRPLPDENVQSFNTVLDFVEKTKPVEPDPNSPEGKAAAKAAARQGKKRLRSKS